MVLIVAFLAVPVTPSPAAEESGSEEVVLSREICSGLFMIPLTWKSEQSGPDHELLAVFDTGGSNLFIDPDSLERVSGKRIRIGKRVRMENMYVAGRSFSRFRPRVKELDHLSRALGRDLDVFLPFAAFEAYLLTMDYPRKELRISRGSLPEPDGIEVFSSRGRDRRPWLPVKLGLKERRLLIDSGSNGTIAIAPSRGLRWETTPVQLRFTQGMEDEELSGVGRLDGSVRIGPLELEDPIVSLTNDTELLGSEVLEMFVLTFDQKTRRVRMQAAESGPVRMEPKRSSGLALRAVRDGLEVMHVVEGSPADRSGIEKGDLIIRLGDKPFPSRDCYTEFRNEQEQHHLTIRRDDTTFEVTVPVEELIH